MSDYDVTPPPVRLSDEVRVRRAHTTRQGDVVAFLVQAEYRLDGTWVPIVRYDHGGEHDVSVEGLHRDVYRDGEKVDQISVTGPIDPNKGYSYAESEMTERLELYVRRFERWHGITQTTNL